MMDHRQRVEDLAGQVRTHQWERSSGRCTTLYLMARLMVCSWIGFSA